MHLQLYPLTAYICQHHPRTNLKDHCPVTAGRLFRKYHENFGTKRDTGEQYSVPLQPFLCWIPRKQDFSRLWYYVGRTHVYAQWAVKYPKLQKQCENTILNISKVPNPTRLVQSVGNTQNPMDSARKIKLKCSNNILWFGFYTHCPKFQISFQWYYSQEKLIHSSQK